MFRNIKCMKQLILLANTLTEFVLQSGCPNRCAHCYADAPPMNHLMNFNFEDFENLCKDFQEVNKRFGFNIFSHSKNEYNTLFHGSDSSRIYLTNAQGQVYDYADLAKMVYDTTNKFVLFDTAGWDDTATQKRIEDLVKKVMNSNEYDFMEFIVSLNPFHGIYDTAIKCKQKGDLTNYQRLKEIYTDRMVRVICTLLPLLNKTNIITNDPMLRFNIRALDNGTKDADGYRANDLNVLTQEIIDKVKIILEQNNVTNREFYINYLKDKFNDVDTEVSVTGRAADLIKDKKSKSYLEYTLPKINNTPKYAARNFENGFFYFDKRFYITNWAEVFPTDIVLNFKNEYDEIPKISPNLREEVVTYDIM